MGLAWLCVVMLLAVGASADRGGSSLRGALEALQRRQRSHVRPPLAPQSDYDALYEFVPPQGYPEPDYSVDVEDVEEPNPRYVVKLLDENERPPEAYEYKLIKKKNTHIEMANQNKQESPFRERTHHPNNDKLRDLFMDKNELEEEKKPEVNEKDAEYALLLGQLWSKYKYSKEHQHNMESAPQGVVKLYKDKVVKKRYPDNWGPIAFKRKRSSDPDGPILPDYSDRKSEAIPDPNYGAYELNDDDKDDLREEYSIAFQPLDDDTLSDLADDDQYTYENIEKRFPVTKRSSGPYDFGAKTRTPNQNKREAMKSFRSSSGTDPKIIKDLSKIFGDSTVRFIKNPVKRSSDHVEGTHEVAPPMVAANHNHTHEHNHTDIPNDDSHEQHGHNMHHPGISGKEMELEHGHGHKHENNHKHEHEHQSVEKESDKPIILKKKSVDWSDYFGIDKRIKKPISFIEANDGTQDKLRKQYFDTFNKEVMYPLNSFRRHSYQKRNFIKPKPSEETEIQVDRTQAITIHNDDKRSTVEDNDSKLDNIDKKLKSMEGFIVDEALHYSANVGDDLDSKEEQEMKEKLLSRLAAAYSLEKMRKALKEFKHSLQTQTSDETSPIPTDETKKKRVAVKKELLNNEIPLSNKLDEKNEDFEDEQGAGHYLNGKVEEQFSEGYMGGSGRHRVPLMSTVSAQDDSCPVLTKIIQRCGSVDMLTGDRGQLFLPLCGLHQICYLCAEAPPTTCDLVFLSEADTICEGDMSCQRGARSTLMALAELHDNLADELDGECEASPCLPATLKLNVGWQRAMLR